MMLVLIQILRRLMQPKVWKFVCFASSIVGLLCYALSSFNPLFGKWTLWKIFLYSVFSFIISNTVLFATAWQRSTTLRVKAHLAFLVLIITSVYSFFFDKVVKGKPDAYSLISCAAFAIMSLTLSRQSHCGFEVDLLYFFCGGLTVQLMKMKLWLILVGASFSYFLVFLRSSLDTPPEIGHLGLQVQDQVVIQVVSDSTETNNGSNARAMRVVSAQANNSALAAPSENRDLRYQDHVDTQAVSYSPQNKSIGDLLKPQFMACIEHLRKGNQKFIPMVSKHVNEYFKSKVDSNTAEDQIPLHIDVNLAMDALPRSGIMNLQQTVKLMVAAGFEEECCHMYSSWRRELLEECLSTLGLQELNFLDVESWIKASKATLRILFPIEKRLCHSVFFQLSSTADISFKEVCKELLIRLLSFADTFANGRYLSNLLCHLIPKVFDTLTNLIPEFESLFSDQYSVSLKNEALTVWKRLSATIRVIQTTIPDGGLHPVTYKVMSRLRDVCKARDTSYEQVFQELSTNLNGEGNSSSIDIQMARIIELLERYLEVKSKDYTDTALGYVFMMNNLIYIEMMAEENKMRTILDKDWFSNNTAKVQQNHELYLRSSWNKVLDFLKLEDNESMAANVAAESMKEKLSLFNLHFAEISNVQSTWLVLDKQLREQTKISLENILLPTYGNFIGRFQDVVGKHAYDYIEYGILDIQDRLNHLFIVSQTINLLVKDK